MLTALEQRFGVGVGLAAGRVGAGLGVGVGDGVGVGVRVGDGVGVGVGADVWSGVCAVLTDAGVEAAANVLVVAVGVWLLAEWLALGAAIATEQVQRNNAAIMMAQPIPSFVRVRRVRYQRQRRLGRDAGGGGGAMGWYWPGVVGWL